MPKDTSVAIPVSPLIIGSVLLSTAFSNEEPDLPSSEERGGSGDFFNSGTVSINWQEDSPGGIG